MSYNIDTWKTKELKDLVIPVKSLYPEGFKNWHPENPEINIITKKISITGGAEGFEIIGEINEGMLYVEKITNHGEGSGHFQHYVLIPALRQSKGILTASCVWEGGDSITRLTAANGVVNDESIDI